MATTVYEREIGTAETHAFLDAINSKHPAFKFTTELVTQNKLPFRGMNIINNGTKLETRGQFNKTFTSVIYKCSYCFRG